MEKIITDISDYFNGPLKRYFGYPETFNIFTSGNKIIYDFQ